MSKFRVFRHSIPQALTEQNFKTTRKSQLAYVGIDEIESNFWESKPYPLTEI